VSHLRRNGEYDKGSAFCRAFDLTEWVVLVRFKTFSAVVLCGIASAFPIVSFGCQNHFMHFVTQVIVKYFGGNKPLFECRVATIAL